MNDEWGTPDWVFELAQDNIESPFGFDAACNKENCLVPEQETFGDLLLVSWYDELRKFEKEVELICHNSDPVVWCNPPYSRGKIDAFIDKALYEARENSVRSVFLVRHDPTTKWFKKAFKSGYCDIYMIPKRIKFKGADNTYPFPNCFIHFKAKDNNGRVAYV